MIVSTAFTRMLLHVSAAITCKSPLVDRQLEEISEEPRPYKALITTQDASTLRRLHHDDVMKPSTHMQRATSKPTSRKASAIASGTPHRRDSMGTDSHRSTARDPRDTSSVMTRLAIVLSSSDCAPNP